MGVVVTFIWTLDVSKKKDYNIIKEIKVVKILAKYKNGVNGLTYQEEIFIQEVVKGNTQREAYRIAFPNSRLRDTSIDSKASTIWVKAKKSGKTDEIYLEAVKEVRTDAIATVTEVLSEITNIAFGKKQYPTLDMYGAEVLKSVTVPQRVKALDMLARYYKLYDGNNANAQSDGVLPELLKYLKRADL